MRENIKTAHSNLTIARIGDFELRYKIYLCKHQYTTHDIEIVKWTTDTSNVNKINYCYTIASFNSQGSLVECGNRLLNSMEDLEDLRNLKKLASIGNLIITTTEPTNIEL